MAKAITTIRQRLNYQAQHAAYFVANQSLFNRVVAFYFQVIEAHEGVLDLPTKEALTALEKLTHATQKNPSPVLPLTAIAEAIPAFFRRAAINAAIGSARSFSASLKAWRRRKEKHEAKIPRKGKKMPNAKVGHLPTMQGVESVPTGTAPPRRGCSGWMSTPELFLPNYAYATSRSYAPSTQVSDYAGVAEAARIYPKRSVT